MSDMLTLRHKMYAPALASSSDYQVKFHVELSRILLFETDFISASSSLANFQFHTTRILYSTPSRFSFWFPSQLFKPVLFQLLVPKSTFSLSQHALCIPNQVCFSF